MPQAGERRSEYYACAISQSLVHTLNQSFPKPSLSTYARLEGAHLNNTASWPEWLICFCQLIFPLQLADGRCWSMSRSRQVYRRLASSLAQPFPLPLAQRHASGGFPDFPRFRLRNSSDTGPIILYTKPEDSAARCQPSSGSMDQTRPLHATAGTC